LQNSGVLTDEGTDDLADHASLLNQVLNTGLKRLVLITKALD
jgi:hypothetical protein